LTMPGDVSAEDLYRWIRRHRPDLASRVVLTVSNSRDGRESEAVRSSGCPVVQKPFAIEDFWAAVQRVLTLEVSSVPRR
jgi:hypothetical protein